MAKEKKGIKADFNLITILTIPIAIAINFIVGNLVLTLRLPVYLDSIGTFLVSLLAGPWVGGITGVLSIAINSVADPAVLPYTIVAGVAGILVGFMARKKMFTNVKGLIVSTVILSIASVILSIVVVIVFFGGFDSTGTSIVAGVLMSAGVPFLPARFLSGFISEVPDKIISLLVPYLVVKGMSDRYLYKFSNGPLFIEARKAKEGK